MSASEPTDRSKNTGKAAVGAASSAERKHNRPRPLLLVSGVTIILVVWFFRGPLRERITESATISNDAPTPDNVAEMIEGSTDPIGALLAAWNSGKIIQREVAIRCLYQLQVKGRSLPPRLEAVLLAAALDPDLNVRETAFGVLRERDHPALAALAVEQLRDVDSEARILGLNHLRYVRPDVAVPVVIGLLNDPDLLIVAMSLKLLEGWSGENFGVKLSETVFFERGQTGPQGLREGSLERVQAGGTRAQAWWEEHRSGFPPVKLETPAIAYAARQRVPVGDFQLRQLDGRKVRLSEFRGKVVVLNFWTTWCSACQSEMPALIALRKMHDEKLAIVGVSLDPVPDAHGHQEDQSAEGENPAAEGQEGKMANTTIREKVARAVKARGINYCVLLDENNEVGGRFNGGELPTTVIIDAEGCIRRRFVGARSQAVLEAMIAEATDRVIE